MAGNYNGCRYEFYFCDGQKSVVEDRSEVFEKRREFLIENFSKIDNLAFKDVGPYSDDFFGIPDFRKTVIRMSCVFITE